MKNILPFHSSTLTETVYLLIEACDDHNCSYEEGWYRYLCPREHLHVSFEEVMRFLSGDLKKAN